MIDLVFAEHVAQVKLVNKSFITGSFAYGVPHADSDVDLVVLMDMIDAKVLMALPGCISEPPKTMAEYQGIPSIRFGNLNLIVVTSQEEYDNWYRGTQELISKSPVSRECARSILRRHCGQEDVNVKNTEEDVAKTLASTL